jgi:hypothetical protein
MQPLLHGVASTGTAAYTIQVGLGVRPIDPTPASAGTGEAVAAPPSVEALPLLHVTVGPHTPAPTAEDRRRGFTTLGGASHSTAYVILLEDLLQALADAHERRERALEDGYKRGPRLVE